jgi:hypothetical protein
MLVANLFFTILNQPVICLVFSDESGAVVARVTD